MSERDEQSSRTSEAHRDYTTAYVGILNTYNEQISKSVDKKNELKSKFFAVIKHIMYALAALFVLSVIGSLIIFYIMVGAEKNNVEILAGAITAIISSLSTMVISIFTLPKIIAEYLFNKEEDKLMSEIIKNIQKYEIDAFNLELSGIKAGAESAPDSVIGDSPAGAGVQEAMEELGSTSPPEAG